MTPAAELSDTDLRTEIHTWAGRIAAGEGRLLDLIAEADARESWFSIGFKSCAHWLSHHLGYGLGTARERVRVARALRELPLIHAALQQGRMTFSQVRAASRVATRFDEQTWIDLAAQASGSQLERLVRGVVRARNQDDDPAGTRPRPRLTHSYLDDGSFTMTFRGRADQGAIVLAAMESACDDLDRQNAEAAKAAEAAEAAEAAGDVSAEAFDGHHASAETSNGSAPAAGDVSAETSDGHEASAETAPTGGVVSAEAWDRQDAPTAGDISAETSDRNQAPAETTPTAGDVSAEAPAPKTAEQKAKAAAHAAWVAQDRQRRRTDLGEGLLHLARKGLEALGREHPESARRSRSRLSVHIDPLSGWARLRDGELLPPGSLDAIAKDLPARHQLRDLRAADLAAHDQGRTARHPSLALRELLGTLDGERCRIPGCTSTHRLHAHHVTYWENGGRTDLANLILVCSRHHTLIHQYGYQLILQADRTLTVRTADGTLLLPHPAPAWDDPTQLPHVPAGTLRSGQSDQRLDLGYAVHVLAQHAA